MTKLKKNKMKTHKGLKKVLNVRQSGSIRQGVLHNTGKNSAARASSKKQGTSLNKSDLKRIKDLI